ncbi:MAG: hypothetical protein ACK41O_09895, partial [Runella zeae]
VQWHDFGKIMGQRKGEIRGMQKHQKLCRCLRSFVLKLSQSNNYQKFKGLANKPFVILSSKEKIPRILTIFPKY